MESSLTKKLLLLILSVLGTLVLAEAAIRWASPAWYPHTQSHQAHNGFGSSPPVNLYDSELGWALSQQPVKAHDTGHSDVVYSVSNGERLTSDQPHSGSIVIAAGCSFTFGQGINDADTWPWLLQEQMPDYHVINVAAMGYGTDQALLAAERALARYPGQVRSVVLGFGVFQIDRNRCPQSWLATTCPFGKPMFVRTANEQVEYKGQVKFRSMGSFLDFFLDHSLFLSAVANLWSDRLVHRIESHEAARQLTADLMIEFGRRFAQQGAQLVIVVMPYLSDQGPQSTADRDVVVSHLRAAGIPTLLLDIPRFPDGRIDPRRFTVGSHPNRQYNLLLADQLSHFLAGLPAPANSVTSLHPTKSAYPTEP